MVSQDTLEVFVESPEAAAPTKKLRKGLSKVFGRKDSDSEGEAECMDTASGVGEAEEALEGHLFSVGVAFAQVSSPCNFPSQLPGYCATACCNLAQTASALSLSSQSYDITHSTRRISNTRPCQLACSILVPGLTVYIDACTVFVTPLYMLQILQLSQHDKAITIYYHPNSFSSTQSIRSNLANCWRFTVALDTPEVRFHHITNQSPGCRHMFSLLSFKTLCVH